jgi:ribosome maturation protein SDO1
LFAVSQIMLIDPGQFKVVTELLQTEAKGKGRMETLNQTVAGDN